jgi:hypothetical protein
MQRGIVHAAAWSLATGAAVTLSWWGVHTVLAGTAYDPPRALPIPGDASSRADPDGGAGPQASSTRRAKPSPTSPKPTRKPTRPPGTAEPEGKPPRSSAPASPSPTRTGNVKSYNVRGGRVVFDLGERSASLVSATPDSEWQMQVWKQPEWIRVNFSQGDSTTSVFCTWNGHPPTVEVVEE